MATDQVRIDFVMHFIEGAQEIGMTTQVVAVRKAWEYFQPRAVIGVARKCDTDEISCQIIWRARQARAGEAHQVICLIPLFAEDVELGDAVSDMWHYCQNATAYHMNGTNNVVLRAPVREVSFMNGCTLLHEIGHVLCDVRRRHATTPQPPHVGLSDEHLQEEVEMHTQEAALWQERGDAAYLPLLEKAMYWIQREWARQGKVVYVALPNDPPWAAPLHEFLGPYPDEGARNNRMFHFSIQAHFALLEKKCDIIRAANLKREVMRTIYAHHVPQVGKPIFQPPASP